MRDCILVCRCGREFLSGNRQPRVLLVAASVKTCAVRSWAYLFPMRSQWQRCCCCLKAQANFLNTRFAARLHARIQSLTRDPVRRFCRRFVARRPILQLIQCCVQKNKSKVIPLWKESVESENGTNDENRPRTESEGGSKETSSRASAAAPRGAHLRASEAATTKLTYNNSLRRIFGMCCLNAATATDARGTQVSHPAADYPGHYPKLFAQAGTRFFVAVNANHKG